MQNEEVRGRTTKLMSNWFSNYTRK